MFVFVCVRVGFCVRVCMYECLYGACACVPNQRQRHALGGKNVTCDVPCGGVNHQVLDVVGVDKYVASDVTDQRANAREKTLHHALFRAEKLQQLLSMNEYDCACLYGLEGLTMARRALSRLIV